MRIEEHLPVIGPWLRHTAECAAPREAAGVITCTRQLVEVANRNPNPTEAFDIGALHDLESREGELMAIWHTHPGDEPPSQQDVESCRATALPWIIAGPRRLWLLQSSPRPYEGREFHYGVDDCWAIACDWLAEERRIHLPWCERPADGWWHDAGPSPYVSQADEYGFDTAPIAEFGTEHLHAGDVILMNVRAKRINHAAVYLGGGNILHHLHGELSRIEQFDGRWQRAARMVARHRLLAC